MKRKKPALLLLILFGLTTLATLYGLYEYLSWMLKDENELMFKIIYKRSAKVDLSDGGYMMVVAVVALLMLMKWAGSFIMLRGKAWGYALYLLPNLILAGLMGMIMSIVPPQSWTLTMWAISGGTLLFIGLYTFVFIKLLNRVC